MNLLKTAFNKVTDAYCTAPLTCNTASLLIATGSAVGFLPYLAFPAIMLLGISALSDVALKSFLNPPTLSTLSNEDLRSLMKPEQESQREHQRMIKMGILKP